MAGRIPRIILIVILVASPVHSAESRAESVKVPLVEYSFDDSLIETGPDTFHVFEHAKGRVQLSAQFPYSGYYSVHLKDEAHDGDFPELQGYFPVRRSGHLLFHFAFMVANPDQALNIALAGRQHFNVQRNGIGFWLFLQEGRLFHMSDSIPKPLFQVIPFTWYQVDMNYHIDSGRYDLRIMDDSAAVVDIKDVANAANQPGSTVDKFSFIGDLWADESSVSYFVDDVSLSADTGNAPAPFVAPGRRKLFIDKWQERQRFLQAKLRCLPVSAPEDFALSQDWLRSNLSVEEQRAFWQVLSGRPASVAMPASVDGWRNGIAAWYQGCQELDKGNAGKALDYFSSAGQALTDAPLLELSRIQALAVLKKWQEVDAALPAALMLWSNTDFRFDVAMGQIAGLRGDLRELDSWQSVDAEAIPDKDFTTWAEDYFGTNFNAKKLDGMLENKRQYPLLQHYIIAEQHFFSLLWRGLHNDAMDYAGKMVRHFSALPKARALWLERVGDAAFLGGLRDAAADAYRDSTALYASNRGPLEKLADLAYLAGNAEQERRYREAVYGALH